MRTPRLLICLIVVMALLSACSEKSNLEQGIDYMKKGSYEMAIKHLKQVKDENKGKAENLIVKAKEEIAKRDKEACKKLANERFNLLKETKTVSTWEGLMEKLRNTKCEGLDTDDMVQKAYLEFMTLLTDRGQPEDYVDAVAKYCEIEKCEYKPPRQLIYEEVLQLTDADGTKRKEIIQEAIPMVDHERAMDMFKWMFKQNWETIDMFDRYGRYLNRMELFKQAEDVFSTINGIENAPFQIKDRARLMVDHLKQFTKGHKKPPRKEGEEYQYFWVEQVKDKSVMGALKDDVVLPGAAKAEEKKAQEAPPAKK